MSKIKDLQGQTFGRLTVLSRSASISGRAAWLCKCLCGNTCIVKGKYLLNGETKSCGCLTKESIRKIGKSNISRNRYEVIGDTIKVYFNGSNKYFLCDKEDENIFEDAVAARNNAECEIFGIYRRKYES